MDEPPKDSGPRVDHRAPSGPPHPDAEPDPDLGRTLRQPLSTGFALVLVVANLLGWVWFANHMDERFHEVASSVGRVSLGTNGPSVADPELCWLVGAQARASGHADSFVAATNQARLQTDCAAAAVRGANGHAP